MKPRKIKKGAPLPRHIQPMLAVLSKMPHDTGEYGFEYKWDGIRALAYWNGKDLLVESRNLIDITSRYPEFELMQPQLGAGCVLDGEIIALDAHGRPSFSMLQRRMGIADRRLQLNLMKSTPATFMIFDILYQGGSDVCPLPYEERRKLLEKMSLNGPAWKTPPFQVGGGEAMLEVAAQHGLEGLIAKRLGSPYEPGRRSDNWRKIKIVQSQEFVIGGWLPGEGAIRDSVGAVLLGYQQKHGKKRTLHYAGNVGTGFSLEDRHRLLQLLGKDRQDRSPFDEPVPLPQASFCKPRYVAEIEFRGWTHNDRIRQGSFKGIRLDKKPEEVIREIPEEA